MCRNATRILVTHQTQWLHSCSRVIVMQAGTIVTDAPWTLLKDSENLPKVLRNLELRHGLASPTYTAQHQPQPELIPDTIPAMELHSHSQKELHLGTNQAQEDNIHGGPLSFPLVDHASEHSSPMAPLLAGLGQEDDADDGASGAADFTTAFDTMRMLDGNALKRGPAEAIGGAVETEDVEVVIEQQSDNEKVKDGIVESIPDSGVVELAAVSKGPSKATESLGTPKQAIDGSSSASDTCAPLVAGVSCAMIQCVRISIMLGATFLSTPDIYHLTLASCHLHREYSLCLFARP